MRHTHLRSIGSARVVSLQHTQPLQGDTLRDDRVCEEHQEHTKSIIKHTRSTGRTPYHTKSTAISHEDHPKGAQEKQRRPPEQRQETSRIANKDHTRAHEEHPNGHKSSGITPEQTQSTKSARRDHQSTRKAT